MAAHSSTLAWKIPWIQEPGGLQSMGSLSRTRLSNFTFTFHFHALEKELATHSSVLALRIPGTGEPSRLPSMGSHRVRHDWSDLAAAAAVTLRGFLCGSVVENLPAIAGFAGDMGLIPWLGRSPERKKWKPTPVFLPGKFVGRGTWQTTVHGVSKSRTWLSTITTNLYIR